MRVLGSHGPRLTPWRPIAPQSGQGQAQGQGQSAEEHPEGRRALFELANGDQFSVADAYLFTVSNWTTGTQVDLSGLSHLLAYRARVAARPAVIAAMQAEGLTES